MKLKIDMYNKKIHILEQESKENVIDYDISDEVGVYVDCYPEVQYSNKVMMRIFLQGWNDDRNNSPLIFNSVEDLLKGVNMMRGFCQLNNWELVLIPNLERIQLL